MKAQKERSGFRLIGEIFEPIIPGMITAGLCSGFASLLTQLAPGYADVPFLHAAYQLLTLLSRTFMVYMTAWTGYSACRCFGGTPILGGMLGMLTCVDGVGALARTIGGRMPEILYDGQGGILAALLGAWLLARTEALLRRHIPASVGMAATPLLALTLIAVPYMLAVMPATGVLTELLCGTLERLCMNESFAVRIITGFVGAALFLVAVMMGAQYAFATVYAMQVERFGYTTLFPALAMAGAGQVGAAAALYCKAKREHNERLMQIIAGAIVPGMMGIGNPLLFGVTLPLGTPFFTAGVAGGVGGAFIVAAEVASFGYGASGLLALPMMTSREGGALRGILLYLAGLCLSAACGFILTALAYRGRPLRDSSRSGCEPSADCSSEDRD